jgi:uncharacterized membrane protein YhaH (DUF805 family)
VECDDTRLHDSGNGSLAILALILPLVNLLALLLVMFVPGKTGPNKFGPDPKLDPAASL